MVARILPSRDLVRQLLDYDADTGVFTWRPRPETMFTRHRQFLTWNLRFAGQAAGSDHRGYCIIGIEYTLHAAHRLAWLHFHGEPVPKIIDHIDGDPGNNRIANLRAATHTQNMANSGMRRNNRSGAKGVRKRGERFLVQIAIDGKLRHIGSFPTLEEAAQAYRDAAARLHGDFARFD
jgi:hypothetical protein